MAEPKGGCGLPLIGIIGIFGGFFALVLCIIIAVWCVIGWVGYKVWNAPAVQEGLGYEEPAATAPEKPGEEIDGTSQD